MSRTFEVRHTLDADVSAFAVSDTLKASAREWTARLQAAPLLP